MCFLIFLVPQVRHELIIPGLGYVCSLLKYIQHITLYKFKMSHINLISLYIKMWSPLYW